ncbi:MAG: winged helix family two component transcriptional regulator [Candidatus Peribacteria bacterium]|nr:winged helix family two component transcriptional regulator [Candidatus Peribacteria bacterium]
MRILVIEDHQKIAESIQKGLKAEGFAVDFVCDGMEGQKQIERRPDIYDLVILDRMLPGKDGLAVCRDLREIGIELPILMLTAKDAMEDRVDGLNGGADDYLVKPFAFEELLARVRTLLRRPKSALPPVLKVHDVVLDPAKNNIMRGSRNITLTTKEFALLEYFMRHPNQVLTREQIVHHVWDATFDPFSNVVDVHMKNLRAKLHANNDEPILETIRGAGYILRG